MNIIIKNSSDLPIYEQIVLSVKRQIISGELVEGYALPSMRALAKELRISVITTKRAYEELEKQGFISSIVGKGSFVLAVNKNFLKEEKVKEVSDLMIKIIDVLKECNITKQEAIDMFIDLCEGE